MKVEEREREGEVKSEGGREEGEEEMREGKLTDLRTNEVVFSVKNVYYV